MTASPHTDEREGARDPLPEHVTMPLLALITRQSLDEDYQHVADAKQRSATPEPADGAPGVRRGTALAVAALGLILTVAFVQTARNASTDANGRAALIEQIKLRNGQVARAQTTIGNLNEQNTGLQQGLSALTTRATQAEARANRLGVVTGYAAVHGPGLRIVADDGPGDDGRIRDEDLATLADGLWSAGAEAIAINGHRLTTLTAIRTSGIAIHVGGIPLSPPYTVLAIGDRATLQSRLADTTHGLKWFSLVNTFGFDVSMQNVSDQRLPAARFPQLRNAHTPGQDDGRQEVDP